MRTTTKRDLSRQRRFNWWMIGFFGALIACEIAREMFVLQAAERPALSGKEHLSSSQGWTVADGTWLRTEEGVRLTPTSVHIECDITRQECLEATVHVVGMSVSSPKVERFPAQFGSDAITYENNRPLCVHYATRIDLRLQKVTAVRQRTTNKSAICRPLEDRVEMELGDGREASVDPFEGHFVPLVQILTALNLL